MYADNIYCSGDIICEGGLLVKRLVTETDKTILTIDNTSISPNRILTIKNLSGEITSSPLEIKHDEDTTTFLCNNTNVLKLSTDNDGNVKDILTCNVSNNNPVLSIYNDNLTLDLENKNLKVSKSSEIVLNKETNLWNFV